MVGFPLTEINDRPAKSAQQDQTARMCSLILLNTLLKINLWSRAVDQGSNFFLFHSKLSEESYLS